MHIHAISTGAVQITESWRRGEGSTLGRLFRALGDQRMTEWLPIYVWVIEHPMGLIVIDTGIPADANRPIYFPPQMRLVQRAAKFRITPEEEIGAQLRAKGLNPAEVRWVIMTHLHQDHDGGLHHFPNAQFIVSRTEYKSASGLGGRMGGYLNQRWFDGFAPTLIDFIPSSLGSFSQMYPLLDDVTLVPTPGHTEGHLSVIVQKEGIAHFFAGDASYSESLLLADALDGLGTNASAQHASHRAILQFAAQTPTIYLPTHDPAAADRLARQQLLKSPTTP